LRGAYAQQSEEELGLCVAAHGGGGGGGGGETLWMYVDVGRYVVAT
jgi:hypothetical protein